MRGYLGNPNRGGQGGGGGRRRGNRDGNRGDMRGNVGGPRHDMMQEYEPLGDDSAEIVKWAAANRA